jgi:hypothetical protein
VGTTPTNSPLAVASATVGANDSPASNCAAGSINTDVSAVPVSPPTQIEAVNQPDTEDAEVEESSTGEDNDSDLGEIQEIDSDDDIEAVNSSRDEALLEQALNESSVAADISAHKAEQVPLLDDVPPTVEAPSEEVLTAEELSAEMAADEVVVADDIIISEYTPETAESVHESALSDEVSPVSLDGELAAVTENSLSIETPARPPLPTRSAAPVVTPDIIDVPTEPLFAKQKESLRPVSLNVNTEDNFTGEEFATTPSGAAPAVWSQTLKPPRVQSYTPTPGSGTPSAAESQTLTPFGIDENANKAAKYAAAQARRAQQQDEEEEGWGSFSLLSPTTPHTPHTPYTPGGSDADPSLAKKASHSYVPTTHCKRLT